MQLTWGTISLRGRHPTGADLAQRRVLSPPPPLTQAVGRIAPPRKEVMIRKFVVEIETEVAHETDADAISKNIAWRDGFTNPPSG